MTTHLTAVPVPSVVAVIGISDLGAHSIGNVVASDGGHGPSSGRRGDGLFTAIVRTAS